MALYTISNGATESSRLTDITITKDATNLATNLESLTLVLELQSPNIWKTQLSYTSRESNTLKLYDNVLNSIADQLSLSIATDAWTLELDYTSASANPDLVFTTGVTALAPSKLTLYMDKTLLHPKLTTEFWMS